MSRAQYAVILAGQHKTGLWMSLYHDLPEATAEFHNVFRMNPDAPVYLCHILERTPLLTKAKP